MTSAAPENRMNDTPEPKVAAPVSAVRPEAVPGPAVALAARLRSTKTSHRLALALVAVYVLVPLVFSGPRYMQPLVASLVIAGVAVPWAMLASLGGLVSFGHAAFFGVGSYASALLALRLGWPVLPALLAGGVIAAASSIAMLPALRLRGAYFALAMLAYQEIFRILVTEAEQVTGGARGLVSIPGFPTLSAGPLRWDLSSKLGAYYIVVSIVVAGMAVYALLRRSVHGLALSAMGETEDATRVLGVHTTVLKTWVLLLSAFLTGLAGAFNAHFIHFLDPEYAFSGTWSLLPTVAALMGGARTVTGPVVGAVFAYLADQLVFKPLIGHGHEIVYGLLLVFVVLFSPDGLLFIFKRRRAPRAAP